MGFFAFSVYVFTFLVRPHEWGGIARESQVITLALLASIIFFVFQRDKNLKAPQLAMMMWLLLAVFASVAVNGWLAGGIAQGEVFIRTALIPFALVSGLVSSYKQQYVLFLIILLCALMMVINGHTQVSNSSGVGFLGNPAYMLGGVLRIRYLGYLSDPNDLGMLLVMCLPIAMLFKDRAPPPLKIVFWAASLLLLYGVYLTNSRGTLLAAAGLMGLWYWRKYKLKKTLMLGAALSPLLLIVMSSFRAISADEESAQGRLDAWYAGYQMLQSNPLFGVGNGAFLDYHGLTAHNSFVLAFAELGVFGCLAWVMLLATSVLGLERVAHMKYKPPGVEYSKEQENRGMQESKIATTLIYSFFAFMVAGFFLSRTYFPLLYLFIGMASACTLRASKIYPKSKAIYDLKLAWKLSLGSTVGGILGVNILIRVFS